MVEDKNKHLFPKGFLWGASTASHQVEGGNVNQWTIWELENAAKLAKNAIDSQGWMPKWDDVKDQAQDPNNYISGSGVDHYRMYKQRPHSVILPFH